MIYQRDERLISQMYFFRPRDIPLVKQRFHVRLTRRGLVFFYRRTNVAER